MIRFTFNSEGCDDEAIINASCCTECLSLCGGLVLSKQSVRNDPNWTNKQYLLLTKQLKFNWKVTFAGKRNVCSCVLVVNRTTLQNILNSWYPSYYDYYYYSIMLVLIAVSAFFPRFLKWARSHSLSPKTVSIPPWLAARCLSKLCCLRYLLTCGELRRMFCIGSI